jgi:putative oxidoreductase
MIRALQEDRKEELIMSITKAVGRAALAAIFVLGGSAAARKPDQRVKHLEGAGLPSSELAVRANGVAMAIAGGMLGLGIAPRAAATVLAVSLVPTTLVGHPFWSEEGEARAAQQTHFMKNLAILGALLLVIVEEE